MTTFVLVHGAWHGGWCWQRVAERLSLAGQSPFQAVAKRLRVDPAWRVHALPTGHDAMVTAPAELAAILLQEA